MVPMIRLYLSIECSLLDYEFAIGKWYSCVARLAGELLVDASTE